MGARVFSSVAKLGSPPLGKSWRMSRFHSHSLATELRATLPSPSSIDQPDTEER